MNLEEIKALAEKARQRQEKEAEKALSDTVKNLQEQESQLLKRISELQSNIKTLETREANLKESVKQQEVKLQQIKQEQEARQAQMEKQMQQAKAQAEKAQKVSAKLTNEKEQKQDNEPKSQTDEPKAQGTDGTSETSKPSEPKPEEAKAKTTDAFQNWYRAIKSKAPDAFTDEELEEIKNVYYSKSAKEQAKLANDLFGKGATKVSVKSMYNSDANDLVNKNYKKQIYKAFNIDIKDVLENYADEIQSNPVIADALVKTGTKLSDSKALITMKHEDKMSVFADIAINEYGSVYIPAGYDAALSKYNSLSNKEKQQLPDDVIQAMEFVKWSVENQKRIARQQEADKINNAKRLK